MDNHSSRLTVTDKLKQLPRFSANNTIETVLPYSGWSLPATICYQLCGVLLPHPFTVYFKLYKSDHIKKNVTTEGSCIKHHLNNQYLKYLFKTLISRRMATGNKQLLA